MTPPRGRSAKAVAVVGLVGIGLVACAAPGEEVPSMITTQVALHSQAFGDGEPIPSRFTCDGADASPPLSWTDAPEGTAAYALIVDDTDAGGFIHWLLADIPAETTQLPEGGGDEVGTPGRNDFGRIGWGGPCPPSGEHRYVFTLYALSSPMGLSSTPSAAAVRAAINGRLLGQATLTGVYRRNR